MYCVISYQIKTLANNNVILSTDVTDTQGLPLFDAEKMEAVWKQQQRHLKCLQDPPGVALYKVIGSQIIGGIEVQVLRCARGSTSLESAHLHINRFIPGMFD